MTAAILLVEITFISVCSGIAGLNFTLKLYDINLLCTCKQNNANRNTKLTSDFVFSTCNGLLSYFFSISEHCLDSAMQFKCYIYKNFHATNASISVSGKQQA